MGTTHSLMWQKPALVNGIVLGFLGEKVGGGNESADFADGSGLEVDKLIALDGVVA